MNEKRLREIIRDEIAKAAPVGTAINLELHAEQDGVFVGKSGRILAYSQDADHEYVAVAPSDAMNEE